MGVNYNPKIVTDGLVFCVDAANKRSYPGAGTTWTDLSKNQFTPSLINSPTFSSNNGGYFAFDGTDEEVDCGFTGADIGIQGTSNASICVWYKKTGTTGGVVHELFGDEAEARFGIRAFNNSTTIQLFLNGDAGSSVTYSPGFLSWNNFVYTYDGSLGEDQKKLYVNGEFVGADSRTGAISSMTNNYHIGNTATTPSRPLHGYIALASLYNRTLTPDEIRQNYLATKGRFQ